MMPSLIRARPSITPSQLGTLLLIVCALGLQMPAAAQNKRSSLSAHLVSIDIDSLRGPVHIEVGKLSFRDGDYVASEPVQVSGSDFEIEAQSMTMKSADDDTYELHLSGEPVSFEYRERKGSKPLQLWAPQVIYHSATEQIEFRGGVRIINGASKLRAERGVFNLQTKRLELLDSKPAAG